MRGISKYAGLILGSLLTAACSMIIDGIRDDKRAQEIADMAAKKAVEEYKRSEEAKSHLNRAQRRAMK